MSKDHAIYRWRENKKSNLTSRGETGEKKKEN